jgi:hypothetical protein
LHTDIQDIAPIGESVAAQEAVARTLDSDAGIVPLKIERSTHQGHVLATREKVGHVPEDHAPLPKSEQIGQVKSDLNRDNNGDAEIYLVYTRVIDKVTAYPTSEDTGTETWIALIDRPLEETK